jgi:hypothetical protein
MANDKLEAAKKRYANALRNELDADELGRIALVVVEAARDARDFAVAKDHAELAVRHYGDAHDEKLTVRSKRRLAGVLLAMHDFDAALPLIDEVSRAPEERDMELPKLDGLTSAADRAIEIARAHVASASSADPKWALAWGALMEAFAGQPIASELERRFATRLGKKNADIAKTLNAYKFHKAAARAVGAGTTSTPTNAGDWLERALAQRRSGDRAAAYDSFCAAAERFEKSYSRETNWYEDEDLDDDTRDRLLHEDRHNWKAADAWREAAECAFVLGDRRKMDAAYDRETLVGLRPDGRKALEDVRKAIAEGRTEDALDVVRARLRYDKGGTPELRALLSRVIAEHVAAGRLREAIAVHDEILDANATSWGETAPAYIVAQLDVAQLLVDNGCVGEARPILQEVSTAISDALATAAKESAAKNNAIARACADALAKVESSKGVELLECVYSPRFTTAQDRVARIRELLASGASIATTDGAGDTVLHHAARLRGADSGRLVRSLVEAGAARSTANAAGQTALDVAAANAAQVADAVEALWDRKTTPSAALEIAASKGHLVTIARLVSLGAGPAPSALSRPFPKDTGVLEFALRAARATGDQSVVDAAFSGAPLAVADVRRHMEAFAEHGARAAMQARFGAANAEKLVAELVYTIASDQILETLVREDWSRFAREDLGLLRASIPADVDDELGEEREILATLETAFRRAAYEASPLAIREGAKRADFVKS